MRRFSLTDTLGRNRQFGLLVSTFSSLLRVDLDLSRREAVTQVVEQHRGIYFGLTRCGDHVLFAARNLDANGRPVCGRSPTNAIYELDLLHRTVTPAITAPCLRDLHQIRAVGHWLCAVLGTGSRIAVFDSRSAQQCATIELEPFVPERLSRAGPDRTDVDRYHFNSLTFRDGRAYVLAHNWQHGSFALAFDYVLGDTGPVLTRLAAVYDDVGRAAHDAAFDRGTLHVLDSERGAVVLRGRDSRLIELQEGEDGPGFARGLALSRDYLFVCSGSWAAERAARMGGQTRLRVLHRATGAVVFDAVLGNYGNSCDVLLTSPRDLSDDPGHVAWQAGASDSLRTTAA